MTTTAPIAGTTVTNPIGHRPYGRLTTTLLVAAPAVMAVGRLLHVPLDTDNAADWEATLRRMAAHQVRSDSGWLLAMVAAGLLSVTALALAQRLTAAGRTKSAGFCLIMLPIAWAGCAADSGAALIMSGMAKSTDLALQAQILHTYNATVTPGIVFLAEVFGAIGYITLAVASARAHIMSRGTAVVLALGGAGTLITSSGPKTPLLVTAAVLLGVGHILAVRTTPVPANI